MEEMEDIKRSRDSSQAGKNQKRSSIVAVREKHLARGGGESRRVRRTNSESERGLVEKQKAFTLQAVSLTPTRSIKAVSHPRRSTHTDSVLKPGLPYRHTRTSNGLWSGETTVMPSLRVKTSVIAKPAMTSITMKLRWAGVNTHTHAKTDGEIRGRSRAGAPVGARENKQKQLLRYRRRYYCLQRQNPMRLMQVGHI